ncbi:MAG: hypothetical protein CBC55_04825 [Gammaproteobacteria bacterium TMED95]|nr:MAG: hypothetical protein CBC55_04825 [Gammaproteobacteria bacterium TMED95]|tara:strand:- start:1218 stop:1982 length:765 start_codon:yes stop_codon:yes gene_type:complete
MSELIIWLSVTAVGVLFLAVKYQDYRTKKESQRQLLFARTMRKLYHLTKLESAPGIYCPPSVKLVIANRRMAYIEYLRSNGLGHRVKNFDIDAVRKSIHSLRELIVTDSELDAIELPSGTMESSEAQQSLNSLLIFLKNELKAPDTVYQETRRAIHVIELTAVKCALSEFISRGNAARRANMLGSARTHFENGIAKINDHPEILSSLKDYHNLFVTLLSETERMIATGTNEITSLPLTPDHGLDRMMGNEKPRW